MTSATIIFLHGLGDSGQGWSHLRSMFGSKFRHVKWVFPDAPTIPISCNGGYRMPGWFDLLDFPVQQTTPEDEGSVAAGVEIVHKLINEEISKGIPPGRIVVAGFSQGGLMSLTAGLQFPQTLAGIGSMSGWLGLKKSFPIRDGGKFKDTDLRGPWERR
eukprot:Rmarinus@m.23817